MKLKRELKLIDVFCISVGAMISSGIFVLPGIAFSQTGPSVFLSYALAGIIAMTGAISIAELASAMPKSGGDYFFITRSLGPLVGTVSGLLSWLAISLKSAFAIFGLAEIAHLTMGFNLHLVAVIVAIAFVLLNVLGVKEAGRFQTVVVLALLAIMVAFTFGGISSVEIPHFDPFVPSGANQIILTAGFVFVSYGGLLKVASVSEEVVNPKRNIPLGIFLAITVVTLLYSILLIVVVGTLPATELSSSLTPIADSAKAFWGEFGFIMLVIASLFAFVSTANAGIMTASRYPYALGKDMLIPSIISKLSKRLHTPVISIVITGVLILLSFFLDLESLVKVASTVVILAYLLSNLSVIVLRESRVQNYRPAFKSPLYPWLQIAGIIIFVLLLFDMGIISGVVSTAFVLLGVFVYFLYGKPRHNKEFALLHLIGRIMDRDMVTSGLDDELKEILIERDDILLDSFDQLVNNAPVIDCQGCREYKDIFQEVSVLLAKQMSISEESIEGKLMRRETENSSALTSFVAVPHILIEGEKKFGLVLVRSKEGIFFSKEFSSVKAMFVMAGTRDERNFHLRALAAIATVISDKEFEKRWLGARDIQNLRDVILLGRKKR
jgi:basic amino acid/polyamine antiporter, APA family